MMTMLLLTLDALVLDAITPGRTVITIMNSGPRKVPTRNHLERTRSTYSRRITAQSLPMTAHPRLHARGADFLEENAVQRWLHQLEPVDARPGLDEPAQQLLRVGAG